MKTIAHLIICCLICSGSSLFAQEETNYLNKGDFSLGVRTTTSLFGHDKVNGLGSGGQFRLQLFDFLSTEFFADWISLDLKGAGTRNDAHVGWSVLFYPKFNSRIRPYLIAGHCFDYAQITPLSTEFVDRSDEQVSRWSSAVQAGIGTHVFLSNRFNASFSAQYMLHFGTHIDYNLSSVGDAYYLDMSDSGAHEGTTEGHLLLTLSLTYRIADLW